MRFNFLLSSSRDFVIIECVITSPSFNPILQEQFSKVFDPNILIKSSSKDKKNILSPISPCLPDLPLS